MFHFIYQLFNTYNTGDIYLFELFIIYAWLIFLPRIFFASKYKHINSDKKFSVSVIIPTFKESKKNFKKCLSSLKSSLNYSKYKYELIISIDGLKENEKNEETLLAEKYTDKIITHNSKNKRIGIIKAIKQAKYDIVITSDSDTFYEKETIKELLKPFKDKNVGGVTTHQRIYNPKKLIQKYADWFENARIKSSLPAMSYFNSVGCLPGRCIAYRKQILLKHEKEFINERFLGILCITGDDRALTNFIIKDGYKSIYQSTARVKTIAPDNLLDWSKQQLRWGRSSQRYTLTSIGWLWKFPMIFFIYITDFLLTLFLIAILIQWVFNILFMNNNLHIPLLLAIILAFFGCCTTVILKQFLHLKENKKDILLVPGFALLMTYMQIIRFYGFLTLKKVDKWMTR